MLRQSLLGDATENPAFASPERALVFEVIGPLEKFVQAARGLGFEWLMEDYIAAEPEPVFGDEASADEEAEDTAMSRMYLTMPTEQGMTRLLAMWRRFIAKVAAGDALEREWWKVFGYLSDLRVWNASDRIEPATQAFVARQLLRNPNAPVRLEVDLWFRQDAAARAGAREALNGIMAAVGGTVLDFVTIEPIRYQVDGMATLVWLRAGEIAIAGSQPPKFDREGFAKLLPALKRLSAFKRPSVFLPRLVEACRAVGVTVATARTPDGCRASGASWFDADGNPIILLSFRFLSEDHFWFTFFHEAAHVVLHGASHIDGEGGVSVMGSDTERQEQEANAFAQELLFPAELRRELAQSALRPKAIMAIARAAGVTSGIIVGQLEKAGLVKPGQLSFMKHRYRWGDSPNVPDLVS